MNDFVNFGNHSEESEVGKSDEAIG